MRQVWISKAGKPDVLEVREAPDPEVGPNELRVRVRAAGINFADIAARMGQYPDAPPIPCVVGYEVAGIVDQIGAGVSGYREGDWVVSFTRFGGYTDTAIVKPEWARPIRSGWSFEKAAAIPVNYATAWLMLIRKGNLQPGETVLVHAAAGGVGQAALQICQWRGARVIGTASSGKHDRLREAGVENCIDYRSVDGEQAVMDYTGGRGVDVVLDAVGGKSFRKSYRCLAPMGRLFCFGASSMAPGMSKQIVALLSGLISLPSFHVMGLIDKNRGVWGTNLGHLWGEFEKMGADLEAILDRVEAGDFDPVIDRTFPFEEAHAAHRYIQERKNFGKVLLTP